jgi:hypothetical protein
MALFYFHIVRSNGRVEDLEGEDFSDLEAAREEAVQGGRDLAAESMRQTGRFDEGAIEIADRDGRHVLTVPFPS